MLLTAPKQPPQPSYEELAEKWIIVGKTERNLVQANVGATVAVAYALLAINDTLNAIGVTLSWSRT